MHMLCTSAAAMTWPLLLPAQPAKVSLLRLQALLNSLDSDLRYAVEVEGKVPLAEIQNLDEVRAEIAEALTGIRDVPNREEQPLIYHLDVAAMYPNIILTNRCVKPACTSCA